LADPFNTRQQGRAHIFQASHSIFGGSRRGSTQIIGLVANTLTRRCHAGFHTVDGLIDFLANPAHGLAHPIGHLFGLFPNGLLRLGGCGLNCGQLLGVVLVHLIGAGLCSVGHFCGTGL
jgi:hypothetical protein